MKKIKIKFVDFWLGFAPANNYFFKLLNELYEVELSEDPDILVYSSYGFEYLKYDCIKIFYTGENIRPDFTGCDFAITFDYNTDPRHYRLPLYALYMNEPDSMARMTNGRSEAEALKIWKSKTKFCCMVVSNGQSKKRLQFFEKLSRYKTVDSGGTVMNNVGGPVKDKMSFIRDYRFVISFENASYPGYTTEKIIQPFMADCIPLYWGNPLVHKDFNAGCFLNLDDGKCDEDFIEEIISVDGDEQKAVKMLMQPKFFNGTIPDEIRKENVKRFFEKIIAASASKTPVARTSKKYLHTYRIKKSYYVRRIKGILAKTYAKQPVEGQK